MTLYRSFIHSIKNNPLGFCLLSGAFCYVAVFATENMLLGYWIGSETHTFREDNFWAFSSGIFRRASVGQVIYGLDLVTGVGPLVFSLCLWCVFLLATLIVYRECWQTLPKLALFFLAASPLVLVYQIDSEILLLIPLCYLVLAKQGANPWVLLLLTLAAIMLREIALILYSPLLIYIFLKGRAVFRVFLLAASCTAVVLHLYKGTPHFLLENTYWPQRGIADIQSHFLYYFIDKSLVDVLRLHVDFMRQDNFIFLPGVLCFLCIVVWVIYRRSQSASIAAFLLAALLVIGVLTVDYGRYFYFFFYFAILVSHPKAVVYFDLNCLPQGLASLKDRASLPAAWLGKYLAKNNLACVLICCLFAASPCGYSAGEYSYYPRIYQMANVILGKLK